MCVCVCVYSLAHTFSLETLSHTFSFIHTHTHTLPFSHSHTHTHLKDNMSVEIVLFPRAPQPLGSIQAAETPEQRTARLQHEGQSPLFINHSYSYISSHSTLFHCMFFSSSHDSLLFLLNVLLLHFFSLASSLCFLFSSPPLSLSHSHSHTP